jgi:hypothetical protein
MDAERQTQIDTLNNLKKLQQLRVEQARLEAELCRCLHFSVFWPRGYTTPTKDGKKQNPKIRFQSDPEFGLKVTMTMTREDLNESHSFIFRTRVPIRKAFMSEDVPPGWREVRQRGGVYQEPHDVIVGVYGRRVVELVESDVADLDVSGIPHESVVAVTKNYLEQD